MPHPRVADLERLIDALNRAKVDFIVVGGAAAVLHGAPTTTIDLDIVHSRDEANVDRLMQLLETLEAYVREPADRRLPPPRSALTEGGQLNLSTSFGPLDPLGRLHDGRGYDELLPRTNELGDDELSLRVLDLETLIEIKSSTGRTKDRLVVPHLLALLEARRGGEGEADR